MPEHSVMKPILSLLQDDNPKVLGVTVGSSHSVKPGEKISKKDAHGLPKLSFNAEPGRDLLLLSLDLDAPFPSFAPLSPIVHWIQTGLKADAGTGELTTSDDPIATWIDPGAASISSPHRYIFLLYHQPADFDASKLTKTGGYSLMDRFRFDLTKFEKRNWVPLLRLITS